MQRYRFFYIEDGRRWYYTSRGFVSLWGREKPGLFTEADWNEWGNDGRNERQEVDTQPVVSAPMLPGMDT